MKIKKIDAIVGNLMNNHRVLVIDDDPKLAALLAEYFAGRGLLVETAADGEEGLLLRRTKSFDIIVLALTVS